MTSIFVDFRSTQRSIVLVNTILVISGTWCWPGCVSSLHKFIVNARNTVAKLFESAGDWRVVISRARLCSHLERTGCNSMCLKFCVDVRFTTGCEFGAFSSLRGDSIASGSGCGLIVVFKATFFAA